MELKLHHLINSRSQRILWLLEELRLDYELIIHPQKVLNADAPPVSSNGTGAFLKDTYFPSV